MALASGGKFRWRRKRGKAARLRPVAEDADSTTWLFHGNGHPRRNGVARAHTEPLEQEAPNEASATSPLLRYEWRTPDGEVLVVEAGWPVPDGAAEPEVRFVQEGGRAPTPLERAGFERPRFRAPARSDRAPAERVPSLDLRA